MIVEHTDWLHEHVACGGANRGKPSLFQIPAHLLWFSACGGYLIPVPVPVYRGLVADKLPQMCSSNVPNSSFISRNFFALLTNDSTFFRFPIMPGLFRIESTLLFVCREILLGLDLSNAFLYAGLLYSITAHDNPRLCPHLAGETWTAFCRHVAVWPILHRGTFDVSPSWPTGT